MNKKIIISLLFIFTFAVFGGCGKANLPLDNKISVVTSFYPLYFFTSEIGGDLAHITNITPAGAEPHDYEPTAQDITQIHDSQLLVLNGGGLEAWGDSIKSEIDNKKTLVIRVGDSLTNQKFTEEGDTITDPHVWLSPQLAQKMVDEITASFIKIDSKNSEYYKANAEALKLKLADLDKEYASSLKNCKQTSIVTSHSAFGYLASTYGLKQISISGLSPEAEPSAKQLTKISNFAKENSIKYIFFESLVSPKLSDTVATEIGAQTLVLNPLEGLSEDQLATGKNYITEMMANLDNLKIALECTK